MHASFNLFSILIEGHAAAHLRGFIDRDAWGDARAHGRMRPVAPIELAELLPGASQADLETFDLAEPAFRLGFGDSGDQVVASRQAPARWAGAGRGSEHLTQASLN